MLPLLALGVGLASGARAVSAAEAKKTAKEKEAQDAIDLAFNKELAKKKAGAMFLLTPQGATQTEHDLFMKEKEALITGRAGITIEGESEAAKLQRDQRRLRERNIALGTDTATPARTIAQTMGETIDPNAVFVYRRVNSFKDGMPAQIRDQDTGRMYEDVTTGQYIPRGTTGAEKLLHAQREISGQQYAFWEQRYPTLAAQWKGQLGSYLEQAALDYTRTVEGDPKLAGQRTPRIPASLIESVATTYTPDLAIELLEGVYNDISKESKAKLSEVYARLYNMRIPPEQIDLDKKVVVNPTTGEEEIIGVPKDGTTLPTLDTSERVLTEGEKNIIRNAGKNINMRNASTDAVVEEIHGLALTANMKPTDALDAMLHTRGIFRNYDNYYSLDAKRRGGQFNIFEAGTGTSYTGAMKAYDEYTKKMGVFDRLDTDHSIAALTLIAPVNALDVQSETERNEMRGPASLYPAFKTNDIERLNKEQEQYVKYIEGTYLGTQKMADITNKADAAKNTVLVGQALMTSYGADSPAIPGIVGSAVSALNGFGAQIDYFMQAIDLSTDTEQQKSKNKEKLLNLKNNLDKDIANLNETNEIAVANAVQKYYEGVLVYSMAMALQGGNAAARTISDADIERIQNLLNFNGTLQDTKVKRAVIQSVVTVMERQYKIAMGLSSKNEARVWAAWTADKKMISEGQGSKDYLFAVLEDEVNRASNGRFYKAYPKVGDTVPLPSGVGGKLNANGELVL